MKDTILITILLTLSGLWGAESTYPTVPHLEIKTRVNQLRQEPVIRTTFVPEPATPGTTSPTALFGINFQVRPGAGEILINPTIDTHTQPQDIIGWVSDANSGDRRFDELDDSKKGFLQAHHKVITRALLFQKLRAAFKCGDFINVSLVEKIKPALQQAREKDQGVAELVEFCGKLMDPKECLDSRALHDYETKFCRIYLKPAEIVLREAGVNIFAK